MQARDDVTASTGGHMLRASSQMVPGTEWRLMIITQGVLGILKNKQAAMTKY